MRLVPSIFFHPQTSRITHIAPLFAFQEACWPAISLLGDGRFPIMLLYSQQLMNSLTVVADPILLE
jgi:hypothetical protein